MMTFLQDLSINGVFICLIVVMLVSPLFQLLFRHKRLRLWFRSDEAVVNYVQMLTVFYGLMLGLVAVDLWQKQDEAEKTTGEEANQVRKVLDFSKSVSGDKDALKNALADYVQAVVKKEWPMMLTGKPNEMLGAGPELDNVRSKVMALDPKTPTEQADISGNLVALRRNLADADNAGSWIVSAICLRCC